MIKFILPYKAEHLQNALGELNDLIAQLEPNEKNKGKG